MPAVDSGTVTSKNGSPCIDRSIRELDLKFKTGAFIVSVRRDEKIIQNPDNNFISKERDVLFLTGKRGSTEKTRRLCHSIK